MRKHVKTGFTLTECLVTFAILGLIAALIIPKLLNSGGDRANEAVVKEIVTNTGELFFKRQADSTVARVNWNADEAAVFSNYILTHMNGTPSAGGTFPIQFASGSQILSVRNSTVPMAGGGNVKAVIVRATVPKISRAFDIVIVGSPVAGGVATDRNFVSNRYTTKYGVTGETNDINKEVDRILKTGPENVIDAAPDTPSYIGSSGPSGFHPYDINKDGIVGSDDATILINQLNAGNGGVYTYNGGPHASYDTSGDNYFSPQDALRIINCLNDPSRHCPGAPV